jgi:hypothetical protein
MNTSSGQDEHFVQMDDADTYEFKPSRKVLVSYLLCRYW